MEEVLVFLAIYLLILVNNINMNRNYNTLIKVNFKIKDIGLVIFY